MYSDLKKKYFVYFLKNVHTIWFSINSLLPEVLSSLEDLIGHNFSISLVLDWTTERHLKQPKIIQHFIT